MIIFRAVNIYPGQIDHILSHVEGIASEYQIVLDRGPDGRDTMTLKVERQAADANDEADRRLTGTIQQEIKKQIMVSADVRIVDYGSLPRSERKSKRVFDHRL
jgi:phenylacetate-CoA ligase